jgi:deazaflavin-dependent oxidoreductase (nitroreductase family)
METSTSTSTSPQPVARPPLHVRLFSPVLMAMVKLGIPLGFNRLMTVRGRKSGAPRSVAVAILPIGTRRWVWAPWGDSHWVRNLRAARQATIVEKGRSVDVTATELDPDGRRAFFRDVLGPFIRRIPFGVAFIRIMDGDDLDRPEDAARRARVFELRAG